MTFQYSYTENVVMPGLVRSLDILVLGSLDILVLGSLDILVLGSE